MCEVIVHSNQYVSIFHIMTKFTMIPLAQSEYRWEHQIEGIIIICCAEYVSVYK